MPSSHFTNLIPGRQALEGLWISRRRLMAGGEDRHILIRMEDT
jgi:hypothetical protein